MLLSQTWSQEQILPHCCLPEASSRTYTGRPQQLTPSEKLRWLRLLTRARQPCPKVYESIKTSKAELIRGAPSQPVATGCGVDGIMFTLASDGIGQGLLLSAVAWRPTTSHKLEGPVILVTGGHKCPRRWYHMLPFTCRPSH